MPASLRLNVLGETMRYATKDVAERNLARIGAFTALALIAAVVIYAH